MFLASVNRDLGFCKNEASLGPFRSVKTVHNRKFLPFFAESGHDLGRVGPFGFAVEGLAGGAVEMNAKELVRQALRQPDWACVAEVRMRQCAQKARAEKPGHASAMEMGSRMIASFRHDERNWG